MELVNQHLFPFSILYLLWLITFYIFDLYNVNISREKFLFYPRFGQALIVSLVIGIALFYLWPALDISPKTNLLINIFFFGLTTLLWRKIFYALFSKRLTVNMGILGNGPEAKQLIQEVEKRPYLGYRIKQVQAESIAQALKQSGKESKIDVLVIAETLSADSTITKSLYNALSSRISFLDLAGAYELICGKIPISFVSKTWFLENIREGQKVIYPKAKRLFDLILASLILIITSPLWMIIALLIKLQDKGPVFYRQKRVGRNKELFMLIKFRSMRENAENGKAKWADKNDKRITRVGKVLRATHLDELPQMINVLKGDVSLVGPRPERPEFVSQLENQVPHYNIRHLIRPGVTGWDQIKFRYANSMLDSFEKFQYDLYYLKNRNLLLDLGILLKTFQSLFRKTN